MCNVKKMLLAKFLVLFFFLTFLDNSFASEQEAFVSPLTQQEYLIDKNTYSGEIILIDEKGNDFNSAEEILNEESKNLPNELTNLNLKLDSYLLEKFNTNPDSTEVIQVILFLRDQNVSVISKEVQENFENQLISKKNEIKEITDEILPKTGNNLLISSEKLNTLSEAEMTKLKKDQQELDELRDSIKKEIIQKSFDIRQQQSNGVIDFVQQNGGTILQQENLLNILIIEIPLNKLDELSETELIASISTNEEIFSVPKNVDLGSSLGRIQYNFQKVFVNFLSLQIPQLTSLYNLFNQKNYLLLQENLMPFEEVNPLLSTSTDSIKLRTWIDANLLGGEADLGIVDTGIDITHPAIEKNISGILRVFDQKEFSSDTTVDDLHFHGTHVTGISAGVDNVYGGIARGVKHLINAKFLSKTGSGSFSDSMRVLSWAVIELQTPADVLNNSWGCSLCNANGESGSTRFMDALTDNFNVVLVFAAGNSGSGLKTIGTPGDAYNVITVGSMDDRGTVNRADDIVSYFSSRGTTVDGRKKPDIVAPGSNITSANAFWEQGNLWKSASGTSMAAPHVSGAATILTDIGLNPNEVKALLINSAEDFGTRGWDPHYGWGYIDLNKAFFEKNFVFSSKVLKNEFKFYKTNFNLGDKATLVWNRHIIYSGSQFPSIYYPLNDLDLYLFNFSNGQEISSSTSRLDNVEQVESNSSGEFLIKVKAFDKNFSPPDENFEKFSLAASQELIPLLGPDLNLAVESSEEKKNQILVNAVLSNKGDLFVSNAVVSISVPQGFELINGDKNQVISSINPNESKTIQWTLKGSIKKLNELNVKFTANSFGETLSGSQKLKRLPPTNDKEPPKISIKPIKKEFIQGIEKISIDADDEDSWIESIDFFVDGKLVGQIGQDKFNVETNLYEFDFNSTLVSDSNHSFKAVAFDALNNSAQDLMTFKSDNTPPQTTDNAPKQFQETALNIDLIPLDNFSGVKETFYNLNRYPDKNSFKKGTKILIESEGTHLLEYYSTDNAGNIEKVKDVNVVYDFSPPYTSDNIPLGFVNSAFTVTLSPRDTATGIKDLYYKIDDGNWVKFDKWTRTYYFKNEGIYNFSFYAVDGVGHKEQPKTKQVKLDWTKPVTTYKISQDVNAKTVWLDFNATDNLSGVKATYALVEGVNENFVDLNRVVLSGEGKKSIKFYSIDRAGNSEKVQDLNLSFDFSPPITNDNIPSEFINYGFNVVLTATDSGTGVKNTFYKLNDANWVDGNSFSVSREGIHLIKYYSVDNEDNTESIKSKELKLDFNAPITTALIPLAPQFSPYFVQLNALDNLSGINKTYYLIEGVDENFKSGSRVLINEDGNHLIKFYSIDLAGNTESIKTVYAFLQIIPIIKSFSIDKRFAKIGETINLQVEVESIHGITNVDALISLEEEKKKGIKSIPLTLNDQNVFAARISSNDLKKGLYFIDIIASTKKERKTELKNVLSFAVIPSNNSSKDENISIEKGKIHKIIKSSLGIGFDFFAKENLSNGVIDATIYDFNPPKTSKVKDAVKTPKTKSADKFVSLSSNFNTLQKLEKIRVKVYFNDLNFSSDFIPENFLIFKWNSDLNYWMHPSEYSVDGNSFGVDLNEEFAFVDVNSFSDFGLVIQDLNAPKIISIGPNNDQTSLTVTLTASTNENAFCRHSLTSTDYNSMIKQFENGEGTKNHLTNILAVEGINTFYVSCEDGFGNSMTDSNAIQFQVKLSTQPPTQGGSPPSGGGIVSGGVTTGGVSGGTTEISDKNKGLNVEPVIQTVLEQKSKQEFNEINSKELLANVLNLPETELNSKLNEIKEFNKLVSIDKSINVTKKTVDKNISFSSVLTITVKNNSNKLIERLELIEEIPKTIALNANEVSSKTRFEIVKADPIIKFVLTNVDVNKSVDINYSVAKNISLEQFNSLPSTMLLNLKEKQEAIKDLCENVSCSSENSCLTSFCNPKTGLCEFEKIADNTSCGENLLCIDGKCLKPLKEPIKKGGLDETQVVYFIAIVLLVLMVTWFLFSSKKVLELKTKKPKN